MKKGLFLISFMFIFAAEMSALIIFAFKDTNDIQDTVLINAAVQSVLEDWDRIESHKNQTSLDYVVLDINENILFKTKSGLSESINMAVTHMDTILDIKAENSVIGKIIIYNNSAKNLKLQKQKTISIILVFMFIQFFISIGYIIYLNCIIIKPFYKFKSFAVRIAEGNLDIPLKMDRYNIFGAFTESFDIMRSELKRARNAEAKANADKKELIAKLSHDIKTPVASIIAVSEVGAAITENEKIINSYKQIIFKANQINTLVTNLFTSALEELEQISVIPKDMESKDLKSILENSDYLHYADIPDIISCILYADKLRLQQVFDNIFANSYKYANTKIDITIYKDEKFLAVCIEDYGKGVSNRDLPLLKEKFKRGSNTKNIEGAGLGLYISDYFMKEMKGGLTVANKENGLKVIVTISLSGVF